MSNQLPLLTLDDTPAADWQLDERTRATGLRGVGEARAALRQALLADVERQAA